MKTILVTGGTGFIGSNLCTRLINDGNRVICLDNNYSGSMRNIAKIKDNSRFNLILHDVTIPFEINEKLDEIYNLACPASPVTYQKDPIFTTKTCVLGALNVLEVARKHCAKILHTSTSEVYGDPIISPQPETYRGNVNPIGLRSCYDEGKRCAESIFFDYKRKYNIDIRLVRIFNTYGPNMATDDGRVISNFIYQSLQEKNLTIYGDGTHTRSFCYIDDTIEFLIRFMNTSDFSGPINIGNPEEITIRDVANKIIELTGNKVQLCFMPLPQDDPVRRQPDISLAKRLLNYTPRVSLDVGLEQTIKYFSNII